MARLLAGCAQAAELLPDDLPSDISWDEDLPLSPLRLDHNVQWLGATPSATDGALSLALTSARAGHQAIWDLQYVKAWEHYATALKTDGSSGALLANQSFVRWYQRNMDEASQLMERASRAAPEDAEIRNWASVLRKNRTPNVIVDEPGTR